jgi:hypothetical protein
MLSMEEAFKGAQKLIAGLVHSGTLERFPDLRFVCIETDAYWLAPLMFQLDYAYFRQIGEPEEWRMGQWDPNSDAAHQPFMVNHFERAVRWKYPLRPSDYVRRQVRCSFQHDPVAIACREYTGTDVLLWGADYPHAEGTWPDSRQAIDEQFAGVDAGDKAAIVCRNLSELYGVPLPAGGR